MKKSTALSSALQKEADLKRQAVVAGTKLPADATEQDFRNTLDFDSKQRARNPTLYDNTVGAIKPEVLSSYAEYIALTKQADTAAGGALIAQNKLNEVLKQLQRLGLSRADALTYLIKAEAENTKKTDDSVEADKRKKQSLADVLKAQLELQKQRLEAQAKDFDRQADNVANPDEVRVRAVQKAAAARKQIAKLDELEQIHEAELKNAKLIDGDKALAVERVRISEATQGKIKELDFNGMRAIVAIKQAGADQLAEIDKQQLDEQAKALEVIGADENRSSDERQAALLNAAAKRIEIIRLESDVKRRAAKGDAEVLKKIQLEEDAAADEQLKKLRAPDADFLNADLDKKYTAAQLALEKSRAAGLFTEKQYRDELGRIDLSYLEKKLANLQKDSTKQQEAADLEVEINRRKNDKKQADDEEARRKRVKLIEDIGQYTTDLEQGYFSIRQNLIDAQIQNTQAAYDAEVAAAGSNAALKAQIDEKYQKQLKKLNYDKAKAERDQALISIAISTAIGIAKAFAEVPFPLALIPAGAALANGLLQAAVVVSQPLPQYFRGREDGPAEWAEVSERGPELIQRKKTGRFEYISEHSIVKLDAHDKVHTAAETTEMLARVGLSRNQAQQPAQLVAAMNGAAQGAATAREAASQGSSKELLAGIKANTEALKKLKQVHVNVHQGSSASVERSNQLTHYLNQATFGRLGKRG